MSPETATTRFCLARDSKISDHLALQVQAVVEDQLRRVELPLVARRRLVQMRIDAWPHQGVDFHQVAADNSGCIGDHSGRRQNV